MHIVNASKGAFSNFSRIREACAGIVPKYHAMRGFAGRGVFVTEFRVMLGRWFARATRRGAFVRWMTRIAPHFADTGYVR